MITSSDKRQANLSILQRLRQQGLPQREEQMDSMFDSLVGTNESGESEQGEEELEAPDTGDGYEVQSPEQQAKEREKKKKGPTLDQGKVGQFKKGLLSVP